MSVRINGRDWNSRFVAYCDFHGIAPEKALAEDEDLKPGQLCHGYRFTCWNSERIKEFCAEQGFRHQPAEWLDETQDRRLFFYAREKEYDLWLKKWVKEHKGEPCNSCCRS
ncbi:MAG: hypothetical protein ABFE07_28930 [Armatimonadia bacterium]